MFSHRSQFILCIALWLAFITGVSLIPQPVQSDPRQTQCELVVLVDPGDPYAPLAKEIAAAEGATLAHSPAQALTCQPVFVLWVASPGSLSDEKMIEFALAMQEAPSAVSPGIITASTLAGARRLWERRLQAGSQTFYAANAPNPAAHINTGRIIIDSPGRSETLPLSKPAFIAALQDASYLTFTGHGSRRYLNLGEDQRISAADIPALEPIVISTGSCQTLRPWEEGSIALGFVDRGAAAYVGFVYSPNEGYLLGEFDGFPYRYTWPDFPIGQVILAQNRGTLQGFAQFPYQFLLGDPRIALQTAPPYRLVEDRRAGAERILVFGNVPSGVIPIRIPGGAEYRFVNAPGVTASADDDPFYNSRLQMVNVREDKLILLLHDGGDLTLRLRRQAPWYWHPLDILLDSFDHALVFSPQSSGDILNAGFAVLPLLWVGWQAMKKRSNRRKSGLALLFGAVWAILQGFYVLARIDRVTIISKDVVFSPLSIVTAFLLAFCGALLFFQARAWIGKAVALAVITFPTWAPVLFGLIVLGVINRLFFIPEFGASLYNYSLGLLPLAAFLCSFLVAGLALKILTTRHGKPAGVTIGFASEDEWFDYRLEHDPKFMKRIAEARKSLGEGKGVNLDDLPV